MHMPQQYYIGIDLGTTNISVAYQLMNAKNDIQSLRIPQLIAPGSVVSLSSLPAVRYVELNVRQSPELYSLPWGCEEVIVGELAKEVSLNSDTQAVHSAKSWLAHPMLDITQACLPIGAMDANQKVSVIQVISEYLTYIEHAWNAQFPSTLFKEQSIVITIPASFDERARQYIVQVIEQCGLERIKLLEEPQAAFYHWLDCHKEMDDIKCDEPQTSLALVCDVGGGTTDFSLISLCIDQSGPHFERIAVGKHLLLGGDNMDLAIYHYLKQKYLGEVSAENRAQWLMQARLAKEKLLANKTQEAASLIVLQKGAFVRQRILLRLDFRNWQFPMTRSNLRRSYANLQRVLLSTQDCISFGTVVDDVRSRHVKYKYATALSRIYVFSMQPCLCEGWFALPLVMPVKKSDTKRFVKFARSRFIALQLTTANVTLKSAILI